MLTEAQLREAYTAAIAIQLDREALLAGFDRPLILQFRAATSEAAQIWEDLCSLNRMGPEFLRTWLNTAAQFAGPRVEADLFRCMAMQLAEHKTEKAPWVGAWVGRNNELAALAEALATPRRAPKPVAICALKGMAGVGKTYLAERFSWEHAAAFPGGVRRLAMRPDEAPTVSGLLGELAAQLDAPAADPAELRGRLLVPRALVHVDNADDKPAAEVAANLARTLYGCALVVTGRYGPLGGEGAWTVVNVAPFDEATAMAQLVAEFREPRSEEREAFARLAGELGYLPLALSLAAAHLRDGLSPEQFLTLLRDDHLDVDHPNPAKGDPDPRRRNVHKTLSLSLDLLRRSLGARGEDLSRAFCALGHAPAAGVGASLGAAITDLSASNFLQLAMTATRLSVLDRASADPPRWRLHPLLAELVRPRTEAVGVVERITGWFAARLPKESEVDPRPQGKRWTEVHEETAALADWLGRVSLDTLPAVVHAGSWYAKVCGPYATWAAFCERVVSANLDVTVSSQALTTLSYVWLRAGDPERALRAADDKAALARSNHLTFDVAVAAGLRADIFQARGQLDEALRIRKEDQLPVYKKLGNVRSLALTMGKIADILLARGQLDEALRILKEDLLPVYERLDDIRSRAVTMGKIADIFQARDQSDEALHILKEDVLPVFEKLGDIRSRAVTMGKIADILVPRGQLDEALRILKDDELPVYERLGDIRSRAVTMGKIADILQARGQLDEALRIRNIDLLPVYESLGDIRSRALTMGRIADILVPRGQLDEAIRIYQAEVLPVAEQLRDRHMLLAHRYYLASYLLARNKRADRADAERLLHLALAAAEESRLPEAIQIRAMLHSSAPKRGLAAYPGGDEAWKPNDPELPGYFHGWR